MIVTSLRRRTAALGAAALLGVGLPLVGAVPASAAANPSYPQQVITIVNTVRAKVGCTPLALNTKLMSTAQTHSAEMATYHYLSVISLNGISPGGRMERAGYDWARQAENIAKGPRTPTDVMNAWMSNAGNRANILNCRFKDIGVGLAYEGSAPVWTQDFGTAR